MKIVKAPAAYEHASKPLVFLAGGITGSPDWQQELRRLLEDLPFGTLLNPRRANFPIHDPAAARQQITWEFQALNQAEIINFWFAREGPQPIVMYEFGRHLARWVLRDPPLKRLIVGIEPGYPRTQDVEIQMELALLEIPVVQHSLREQAQMVREAVVRVNTARKD